MAIETSKKVSDLAFVQLKNCKEKGVTLAICTHNGVHKLENTIRRIQGQKVSDDIKWELLIVDNASKDNTSNYVTQLWGSSPTAYLRIIVETKLGVLYARQKALREARYSYLSFIDDDNWISSNWIEEIHRIFESYPTVGLISCPSTAHLTEDPPPYFEGLKGWLAVGQRCSYEGIIKERPMSFWTAGLSLRLEAFDALDNTSYSTCLTGRTGKHTYGGEDHEICLTLTLMEWHIYYASCIYFTHDISSNRLTPTYFERLIINGGKSKVILDIYRNEYWKQKFYNPYLSILEYFWYFCERASKYWLKRFLGMTTEPLNPNRISYLHAIGRIKGYFIRFKQIAQAQHNIRILHAIKSSITDQPD